MNTVQKNNSFGGETDLARSQSDSRWAADLAASRDLSELEKERHGFVIGWFEKWLSSKGLGPGRLAARQFWEQQVMIKPRQPLQKEQWEAGIRWFLDWFELDGPVKVAAQLQYGAGLRLNELVSLRIKDVDTDRQTVTVRGGKGDKDRVTVLPNALIAEIEAQKAVARPLFEMDRAANRPRVFLAKALGRKHAKAATRNSWSDLSYQDVAENFVAWDSQKIVAQGTVGGRDCQVLESRKSNKDISRYDSVRSWIDPSRFVPLRIEKHDRTGSMPCSYAR